jgi:ADP-heptose:LPS heptosyltransferase
MTDTDARNILVMILGQLGDVVLGLPAINAVRSKYPKARITVLTAKPANEILEISGIADDVITVDRAALRKGAKLWAIGQMFRLVSDIRKRNFDLVIDLHSLYETNILGFLSGAPNRLFANRENRSIDLLSNVRPRPPKEDKSQHKSVFYLNVLRPLGSDGSSENFRLPVPDSLPDDIRRLLDGLPAGKRLIGLFVGAGHPGRQWRLQKFAELAAQLKAEYEAQIVVVLGPEERPLAPQIASSFPADTFIAEGLSLSQLISLLSVLDLFISHDTGPSHLAAVLNIPMIVIMRNDYEYRFAPRGELTDYVATGPITDITVEDVLEGIRKLLRRAWVRDPKYLPEDHANKQKYPKKDHQ